MADEGIPGLGEGDIELIEARLRDALRIEPLALEEEFVRCPSDIAYWAARNAAAIGAHLRAKARAKKLRGLLFLEARQAPEPEPEPDAPTAADLAKIAGVEEDDADMATAAALGKKAIGERKKAAPKPKAPPRVTEKDAEARVDTDPRWEEAQEDEIAAEVEREKMKGAVLAMLARKDMLVQLGANQRAELERDPMVRERLFADRTGRARE